MHIKSIEIVGFKSYSNVKVELDSHHKRVPRRAPPGRHSGAR
jgi:hypothetical protein